MNDLQSGDLTISVTRQGPDLCLTWTGRSNAREPHRVLKPFFDQVLASRAHGDGVVHLRFEQLEHFNSSTITAIIQLIQLAREKQVPLVLSYDEKQRWQKLSFDALKIFAKAPGSLELRPV